MRRERSLEEALEVFLEIDLYGPVTSVATLSAKVPSRATCHGVMVKVESHKRCKYSIVRKSAIE